MFEFLFGDSMGHAFLAQPRLRIFYFEGRYGYIEFNYIPQASTVAE